MKALYLGVDVSKGYADFFLVDQEKEVIEPCFRLDDNPEGHSILESFIREILKKYPNSELFFGVESTGGYENNWLSCVYNLSNSLPIHSARINPCGIKKYMDAELMRTINDEISAQYIAQYMIVHPDKILYDQQDPFYNLKREWNSLCMLKKIVTQLSNNLQSLLYITNPGVLIYCRRGIPRWLYSVLHKYPTTVALARARCTTLAAMKHVGARKAETLIRYAKADSASVCGSDVNITVVQMVEQILFTLKKITVLENKFIKAWHTHPSIQLISSIRGIGDISAIGLMLNIRDIRLYPKAKNLASYFGLHPIWKQSGDGSYGFQMSKIGRKQPRAILYMTTLSAIVHNPIIKKLYARCLGKNMNKMKTIGICMHKMLRIVYGVLKTQKPFDPAVDEMNQKKKIRVSSEEQQKKYEKKLRRFQVAKLQAPISKRQEARRKKGNGSQSNIITKNGITTPSIAKIAENNNQSNSPEISLALT